MPLHVVLLRARIKGDLGAGGRRAVAPPSAAAGVDMDCSSSPAKDSTVCGPLTPSMPNCDPTSNSNHSRQTLRTSASAWEMLSCEWNIDPTFSTLKYKIGGLVVQPQGTFCFARKARQSNRLEPRESECPGATSLNVRVLAAGCTLIWKEIE